MKKFDTLIANYLYSNRQVDLEGIGSFRLDENFVLPPDADKTTFFPLEGIHFEHNTKVETSPALIDYIVQHTGKIKSLVRADFSSYVSEVRQFVNIGKPWAIEGIGTLQKARDGRFELIPGEALAERVNIQYIDEDEAEDEEPVKRKKWMVGFILTLAIIAVVAGLAFGVYVLFIKTNESQQTSEQVENVFNNDDTQAVASTDTLPAKDTVIRTVSDSANYKIYHEITASRNRAVTRTNQLGEYGVRSYFDSTGSGASLRYRLFVYQNILPADTTRVKDSLRLYFGRPVWLERLH
ncbi:MAG TPA: hypothetical protein VF145_12720 [Chitinophagaceae bacterium]